MNKHTIPPEEERMLRLECLRLANGNVTEAAALFAFVSGGTGTPPPPPPGP